MEWVKIQSSKRLVLMPDICRIRLMYAVSLFVKCNTGRRIQLSITTGLMVISHVPPFIEFFKTDFSNNLTQFIHIGVFDIFFCLLSFIIFFVSDLFPNKYSVKSTFKNLILFCRQNGEKEMRQKKKKKPAKKEKKEDLIFDYRWYQPPQMKSKFENSSHSL